MDDRSDSQLVFTDSDLLLDDDEARDLEEARPTVSAVAYSGQDFDVWGLVRRLDNGDMKIPQFGHHDDLIVTAGFQRSFVWNRPQMDRFIESLLLGYPIPGIFLVRQSDKRYLVLDGQQRLRTLQYFYKGVHQGRTFALKNVADKFRDLTYETLTPDLRRGLDSAFIQATIVDSDGSGASLDAVYQIFERLNSGGTQLTAHEIRVALYAGELIDYIETLNLDSNWRKLYGEKNQRIRDQELVLRIMALYLNSAHYSRPQKTFLNEFLSNNRNDVSKEIRDAGDLFKRASELLVEGPGPSALRRASRQVNNSQTDALYVGLMRRLAAQPISSAEVTNRIQNLRGTQDYQDFIAGPTADEEMVKGRLRIATFEFLAP